MNATTRCLHLLCFCFLVVYVFNSELKNASVCSHLTGSDKIHKTDTKDEINLPETFSITQIFKVSDSFFC